MVKTLFHGSRDIIENPIFGYGKAYNDYGLGFYCTESKDLALEWAVGKESNGFANCYEVDFEGLKVLDLNESEFTVLHWIAILLDNRQFEISSILAQEAKEYILNNFLVDYESYDVIIGYRADDSYFSFAEDFLNGMISVRQLGNALYLGKLGQQVVLKSKEAFDRVRYKTHYVALNSEWYARKSLRDKTARREYFDIERNRRQKGDMYIVQILDEEVKPDDPRLR